MLALVRPRRGPLSAVALVVFALAPPARGESIHRELFSRPGVTQWQRGPADAKFLEAAHAPTEEFAHSLPSSEAIRLTGVELGTHVHYYYPTPPAALTDEFRASVWVKASRPGVQLLARLVLPNVPDPDKPGQPLAAVLRGDVYQTVGRWQPLELARPVRLLKEYQKQLQAQTGQPADVSGAFVDRLILNVYGGPGAIDVYVDDLEIGPTLERDRADPPPAGTQALPASRPADRAGPPASEAVRGQLLVKGERFLMRGIRHSDTP